MNEIIGYKSFSSDLTNKYGQKFEKNVIYKKEKALKFGLNGHGYHFCSHLEDTFRYFNCVNNNVCCKVVGSGNFIRVSGYAYDAADMYVSEQIEIVDILTRKQIFEYALSCDKDSFRRLLALYCFTEDELIYIKKRCISFNDVSIMMMFDEFQNGDLKTFKRSREYLYGPNKVNAF